MDKTLSIIIPIYNEEDNINELYKKLNRVIKSYLNYEIIFINDASTDKSFESLCKISELNKNIKIINFTRNFGHQASFKAGIDHSSKDIVVLMDGDLQDDPENIHKFIEKINEGYNIAYAIRIKRKETFFKRFAYKFFYRLLRVTSDIDIPLDSGDFSAMDRIAIKKIKKFNEKNIYLRGIRSWIGLKQIGIPVERKKRFAGKSKYSLSKLTKLAYDGIISFSTLPLKIASYFGIFITFLSLSYIIIIIVNKLIFNTSPQGWPSLMVIILFLGGIQLVFLGLIGEYLIRIYDEVKNRPNYLIKERINFDE